MPVPGNPGQGPMPIEGPSQGAPKPQPSQGPGQASQAIQMIQQGFQTLGKILQSAGQSLDPQDIKLFQQAQASTEAFVDALTSPPQQGPAPAPQGPKGPMPMNANSGAKPVTQGA